MAVLVKHHCAAWKMLTSQLKSKWQHKKRNRDHTQNQDLRSTAEFQACEPPIPVIVCHLHWTVLARQQHKCTNQQCIWSESHTKIVFLWHSWCLTVQGHLPLPHCFREGVFLLLQIGQCIVSCCGSFFHHVQNTSKGLQWMQHKLNAACSHGYIGMPIHDI